MARAPEPGTLTIGGIRWWMGQGERPSQSLAELLDELLERFRTGSLRDWKDDPNKQMVRVASRDGREWLLKIRRYAGAQRLRRRIQGGKARRELELVRRVVAAGVATPAPLAAGEERSWWSLERDYLVLPYLASARDLRQVARSERVPARRLAIARAVGDCTRRLAAGGIFQEDFAPNNFLVVEEPRLDVQAIDFERAHPRAVTEAELVFCLSKLLREMPDTGALERRALVAGVRPQDPAAARRLWRQVAAELPRRACADLARLERVVSRSGRRFRRLGSPGRMILARRSLDDAALEAAVQGGGDLLVRTRPLRHTQPMARHLALAELLFHRNLGPRPLLAVREGGRAWLGFEPPESPAPPAPGAIERLLRGLLAIGRLPGGPPPPGALCGAQRGRRALLVEPWWLEPGAPPPHPSQLLRGWGIR